MQNKIVNLLSCKVNSCYRSHACYSAEEKTRCIYIYIHTYIYTGSNFKPFNLAMSQKLFFPNSFFSHINLASFWVLRDRKLEVVNVEGGCCETTDMLRTESEGGAISISCHIGTSTCHLAKEQLIELNLE